MGCVNEPDNLNTLSYGAVKPHDKVDLVLGLLPKVFRWARAAAPMQPLTSAVWNGCWSTPDRLTVIERIQLQLSDVVSFHSYDEPEEFKRRLQWLQGYGRPILCTEYLARQNRCTFKKRYLSRRIRSRHTIGGWLPAKRRPICRGIPGEATLTVSQRIGFTRSSARMGNRIVPKKSSSLRK